MPVPRTDDNWIQTYTGRKFHPLNPDPEEIDIVDIAHALSNICRFNGHVTEFYSVAAHSIHVSYLCSNQHKKWGLMHDAAEAYLCDLARPIKNHFHEFKVIEDAIEKAVADRFGLTLPIPDEVKHQDIVALATERRDLMAKPPIPWISTESVTPDTTRMINGPFSPRIAENMFLNLAYDLGIIS